MLVLLTAPQFCLLTFLDSREVRYSVCRQKRRP